MFCSLIHFDDMYTPCSLSFPTFYSRSLPCPVPPFSDGSAPGPPSSPPPSESCAQWPPDDAPAASQSNSHHDMSMKKLSWHMSVKQSSWHVNQTIITTYVNQTTPKITSQSWVKTNCYVFDICFLSLCWENVKIECLSSAEKTLTERVLLESFTL